MKSDAKGKDNLTDLVERYNAENPLVREGDRVLISVSGGPDSVALFFVLKELSQRLNFQIACFHLEHGLRGERSLSDQRFVQELCNGSGIVFHTENVRVTEERKKKESLEEAARRVRFDRLHSICEREGFGTIATGHTLDDNVETILLRLLSGTGPCGFRGILPKNGMVIHPLLCVTKQQVLGFLNESRIPFRVDETNSSNEFLRNRIRNRVMPLLQEINGSFREHILNFSRIIQEEDELLTSWTEGFLQRTLKMPAVDRMTLDGAAFASLPDALRRRVIIECVNRVLHRVRPGEKACIPFNTLTRLTGRTTEGNKTLYSNELFSIKTEYGSFVFEKKVVGRRLTEYLYIVKHPGETLFIREIGQSITFFLQDSVDGFEDNSIYADCDRIGFPILVRSRREGDRIELKNSGRKKLKSIFIDDKLPRVMRDSVPVLESRGEVAGVFRSLYGRCNRVAERFRVSDRTKKVLVCTLQPQQTQAACGQEPWKK
jgi:tRNA(Ile)-lysidine synthase